MSKAPEPIILAVALLLLAVGAGSFAYFYPSTEDLTGVKTTEATGEGNTPLKADKVRESLALWEKPVLWQEPENHHRLFDSEKYLFYPSAYPNGDYIKKYDPLTRSPSGVLLSWYQKNHLDFTDPNVDHEDPDNDGFSNIVEYKNDPVGTRQNAADCDGTKSTDPRDPKSHPDYLARLRLLKYEPRPFHILFTGYQQLNGVYLFQLRLAEVPPENQPALKKSGDELGFEGYVIGAFHQEFKDVLDARTHVMVNTDVSTLELLKPNIGFKVVLPFRQNINSPESTADFVMLMPTEVDKVIKVARGKVFTGPDPYMSDRSFLVIDASDAGAVIRDQKTNEDYKILKLDPAEWNEVPGVAAQAGAQPAPQGQPGMYQQPPMGQPGLYGQPPMGLPGQFPQSPARPTAPGGAPFGTTSAQPPAPQR